MRERRNLKKNHPKQNNTNQWNYRTLSRRLEKMILQDLRCWEWRRTFLDNAIGAGNKSKVMLCRLYSIYYLLVRATNETLFVSSCASLIPSDTQTWAVESVTLFGLEKYQILATYLRSCRMSMSPRFVTYVVVRNVASSFMGSMV